jgi:alanyl-tRNA synthetase
MIELYQREAYARSVGTRVVEVMSVKKRPAVALADNLLYPGGGGQPCDTGSVTLADGRRVAVTRVLKFEGRIWAVLGEDARVARGDEVTVEVDWARRYVYMRYHTASHVVMAAMARVIEGYAPKGVEIAEDGSGCTAKFEGAWKADRETAVERIETANRVIGERRAVGLREFATIEEAAREFGALYRGPKEMKGPVSIVVIEGWDANPCGGTHLGNVKEAGPLEMVEFGPDRISFKLGG